ncbi:uncharacterized protein [Asterias amurensis]|uniref:uncharacterized protein n=1 Tax=Asterias amurensis TaxID=7602 RepID=UPI003AB4C7CB
MESDIENDPRAHSTPKREEAASERNIDDDSLGSPELVVGRSSGLERTGASTRSLLSVLSHSSVENISDGSYSSSSSSSTSSSSKLSSRKRRSESPPSSSITHSKSSIQSNQSGSRTRSASTSKRSTPRQEGVSSAASSQSRQRSKSAASSSTGSTSRTTPVRISSSSSSKTLTQSSPHEPELSPWEKWLVQKTEEERKRVRLLVRKERSEQRKKDEEERAKKEKEAVVKVRVNEWVEEKTNWVVEMRKKEAREEQKKKDKKEKEKQEIMDRAKASREQWLADKKEKALQQKTKEDEEKSRLAEEERERKAKADEAYNRWYKDAVKKPKPVPSSFGVSQGMLKGYYNTATYPIPNYYNPVPWMPIHIPKPTEGQDNRGGKKKSGPRSKTTKKSQGVVLQPASPPLLFKERETREKCNKWGRPR